MDADRIESMLRAGPPGEPRYEPLFVLDDEPGVLRTPMQALGRSRPEQRLQQPFAQAFGAVALATLVIAGALLVRSAWNETAVGTPSSVPPATASPSPSPRDVSGAELERTVGAWVTEFGADAAVGVAVDGQIYAGGTIHAASSLIRIGQVSRLYLAAVALQLVDEGALSLDDRLSRFVPEWPHADAITIRMLLDGSSGVASFGEPLDVLERRVAADPSRPWGPQDALEIAIDLAPRFDPGTRASPTDTDDALLAVVIDQSTGATTSLEIRRRVLDPFDLRTTFAAGEPVPPAGTPTDRIAGASEMLHGHRAGPAPGVVETVDDLDPDVLAVLGPSRGMAATVVDLARWSHLVHREPDVLSERSRALLDDSYERGGVGGIASCPCAGASTRALVIGGPAGAYSALVAWFPHDGTSITIATDRVVSPENLQALLERVYALVPPSPGP